MGGVPTLEELSVTVVNIKLRTPSPDGAIPADSRVSWQAVERILGPDYVVLKARTSVQVTAGAAAATIEPGVYWFTESAPGGENAFRVVPPAGPVNYRDLAAVDPATLEPAAAPAPAWYAYADGLEAAALDAVGAAEASQLAAEGSQDSALASKTAAGNSAALANQSATTAGTYSEAAGISAAAASGSASDAAGSASTATARAQEAVNSASAADTSAGDAESYASAAAALRDTMVNGGSVNVDGHLILARVGAAPLDAGYVVGPAPIITVVDTVTGPETAGATGATGGKGDKGDPGGFTLGTALAAEDLNTITVPGLYRAQDGAQTTLVRNYPTTGQGWSIEVYQVGSGGSLSVIQKATSIFGSGTPDGRAFYQRRLNGGIWSTWKAFTSARVDQSAGRAIYQWDDLNSREQLVYGDTGWRNVDTLAQSGITGAFRLRRTGYVVEFSTVATLPDGTPANTTMFAFPAGFVPAQVDTYGFTRPSASLTQVTYRVNSLGVSMSAPAWQSGLGQLRLQGIFHTNDPWPVTLPGTASGTIPNV